MHSDQIGRPIVLTVPKVPSELVAKGLPLHVVVKTDKLWRDGPKGRHLPPLLASPTRKVATHNGFERSRPGESNEKPVEPESRPGSPQLVTEKRV